jgi:predicted Zn-dependent protease with MMP-like domain
MVRNLADPDYEPTDEDLQELSRTAFAHVPAQNRELLVRLRAKIAAGRKELLERLAAAQSEPR